MFILILEMALFDIQNNQSFLVYRWKCLQLRALKWLAQGCWSMKGWCLPPPPPPFPWRLMDDIQLCISGSDSFSQVPEPMFSQQTPWLHSAVPNAVRPSFLTEPMLFSISWFLLVCFCQRRASSPFQLPHQKSKYQFYHLNMLSQHTHTRYILSLHPGDFLWPFLSLSTFPCLHHEPYSSRPYNFILK